MNKGSIIYTLYWQFRKGLLSMHFNILFFMLSQLIWPLILTGTYYLTYSPLIDPANPGAGSFSGGIDIFTYLVPGIIVVFLYLEYLSIGIRLSVNRDYGVLEPEMLTPINRMLWLFGTAASALPSGLLATAGFLTSAVLLFNLEIFHPVLLSCFIIIVIMTSLPWGALVCAIFLCGRNARFLYSAFESPAEFFSGTRFPLSALPAVLSTAALFYPLSHAVNLLRLVLSREVLRDSVVSEMKWIAGLCVLYTIIAAALFSWAEAKGKRDGNLTFS